MPALLALMLQAAPTPPAASPAPAAETPPDVVVIARPQQDLGFRLKPLPPWRGQQPGLPRAAMALPGGGTVSLEVEQGADLLQANRAMVRLKLPF